MHWFKILYFVKQLHDTLGVSMHGVNHIRPPNKSSIPFLRVSHLGLYQRGGSDINSQRGC